MRKIPRATLVYALFLAIVFVTGYACRAPLLTRVARWLHRVDEPAHADVIAVLGGESSFRVMKAVDLWRAGYATRIVLTGPDPEFPDLEQPSYMRWLRLLDAAQVPADSVEVLHPSYSTFDDARLLREHLASHHFHTALVVTDPYHTRRARWVLRRTFAPAELSVRVVASDAPWVHPERWWRDERQLLAVGLEYAKLGYYAKTYGWRGPIESGPQGLHRDSHY